MGDLLSRVLLEGEKEERGSLLAGCSVGDKRKGERCRGCEEENRVKAAELKFWGAFAPDEKKKIQVLEKCKSEQSPGNDEMKFRGQCSYRISNSGDICF